MRVLVVEDDKALGLFLQKGLTFEGHAVELVGDGESALASADAHPPDLMVLDLGLPRLDGIHVLAEVRAKYKDVSVLVLTGRSDVEERIRCLRAGADDCVVKPFSFHELMARCIGILGRKERRSDPMLRHGGVEMNRIDRSVRRNGIDVELTAKEFALLEFMLMRQGECCSRADLLREVWHASPDGVATNIVDVYINYLRKKLGAAHVEGQACDAVIDTIRGSGYRMSASPDPVALSILAEAAESAAVA